MTEQSILFVIFICVFAFFLWGKFRYDLVSFCGLLVAWALGIVDDQQALSGFGHPATVVVALVLIISAGLFNSGFVNLVSKVLEQKARSITIHISIFGFTGAILSAVMNNIAAMALLLPINKEVGEKAGFKVSDTLMPLSFATILGGLTTMIGTPPNIIISLYREEQLGEAFEMFDYLPVGGVCAVAGLIVIASIGWRLIPNRGSREKHKGFIDPAEYVVELSVPEGCDYINEKVGALQIVAEKADIEVIGLVRNGARLPGYSYSQVIRENDLILVEGLPQDVDTFKGEIGVDYFGEQPGLNILLGDLKISEVVVPVGARIEGRTALSLRLRAKKGITLLGISRSGKRRIKNRVRHEPIRAGDTLLLLGEPDAVSDVIQWLRVLPLVERGIGITRYEHAGIAGTIFLFFIGMAIFKVISLVLALAMVSAIFVLLGIVPLRTLYKQVNWPVIVLLGSMLPLGVALEDAGGTLTLANTLLAVCDGMDAWIVLLVFMMAIMTLSDILNNTAIAVIGAPVALHIAGKLDLSPDPFLMGVAIAASCAFLTPIGHQNNTLIMGPGGYKFGDYWRMGLLVEILVLAISVPLILIVFPL